VRRTVRFDSANYDVVVVAASYGGLGILRAILGMLPAAFSAPLMVVQHVSDDSPGHIPNLLAPHTRLHVRHAAAGDRLRAGSVFVAAPGRHLLLGSDATCQLSNSSPVNFTRPAADPLFSSAARACGSRTLGVILTGRHRDGTIGAQDVRAAGGIIIVQEPDTCLAPGMPESAIQAGAVDLVLTPPLIAAALVSLVTVPGVPALFGFDGRPRSAA
jgi:two-component system chemotaxis response regulator CheB